jgi:hypothetical protein
MKLPEEQIYLGIDGEEIIRITNQKIQKIDGEYFLTRDQWIDPTFDRLSEEAAIKALRIVNLLECEKIVPIDYTEWWETIQKPCNEYNIIDQGLARCTHDANHWQWCSFDTCPKKVEQ